MKEAKKIPPFLSFDKDGFAPVHREEKEEVFFGKKDLVAGRDVKNIRGFELNEEDQCLTRCRDLSQKG